MRNTWAKWEIVQIWFSAKCFQGALTKTLHAFALSMSHAFPWHRASSHSKISNDSAVIIALQVFPRNMVWTEAGAWKHEDSQSRIWTDLLEDSMAGVASGERKGLEDLRVARCIWTEEGAWWPWDGRSRICIEERTWRPQDDKSRVWRDQGLGDLRIAGIVSGQRKGLESLRMAGVGSGQRKGLECLRIARCIWTDEGAWWPWDGRSRIWIEELLWRLQDDKSRILIGVATSTLQDFRCRIWSRGLETLG